MLTIVNLDEPNQDEPNQNFANHKDKKNNFTSKKFNTFSGQNQNELPSKLLMQIETWKENWIGKCAQNEMERERN